MERTPKESKVLQKLFGNCDEIHISQKLVEKLVQYNMKYEEITKVILTHSERTFLDARLITIEEYYNELQQLKTSEVRKFLASLDCSKIQSKKLSKSKK